MKQGTLCSFLTRLDIKEKDYNRIDYEKHEISLDGTHITIHQHSKHKQSFLLTDLKEVRYINELILLLEFSHDK